MSKDGFQKRDCDRSGFTHRKCELVRQRGLLVASDEVDDLRRIVDPSPRWGSPRGNSTTVTAVTSPTVFSISAGSGISSLSHSYNYRQDGVHEHYYMKIVGSGGAVTISANPQIVAGQDGVRLTLHGTSDTNTVTMDTGNGIQLIGGLRIVLKNNDVITFVYTSSDTTWRETSRTLGGGF